MTPFFVGSWVSPPIYIGKSVVLVHHCMDGVFLIHLAGGSGRVLARPHLTRSSCHVAAPDLRLGLSSKQAPHHAAGVQYCIVFRTFICLVVSCTKNECCLRPRSFFICVADRVDPLYEDPRTEVRRLLDKYHCDRYKVYNFASELAQMTPPAQRVDARVER